jgi:hypothetical protein
MSTFDVIMQTIEDLELRGQSYSGRGMYGRRCLGVTLDRDSGMNQLEFVANLAASLAEMADRDEDAQDALYLIQGNIASDSMGLGSVVYFPDVPWEDNGRL